MEIDRIELSLFLVSFIYSNYFTKTSFVTLYCQQQHSTEGPSSASDYVRELQKTDVTPEHLLKMLQSCRVSLTGRPLR